MTKFFLIKETIFANVELLKKLKYLFMEQWFVLRVLLQLLYKLLQLTVRKLLFPYEIHFINNTFASLNYNKLCTI